jgi:hypothetical protein
VQINLRFSLAEVLQLLSYARARDEGDDAGWYYGDKDAFEARHKRIIDRLDDTVGRVKDHASSK